MLFYFVFVWFCYDFVWDLFEWFRAFQGVVFQSVFCYGVGYDIHIMYILAIQLWNHFNPFWNHFESFWIPWQLQKCWKMMSTAHCPQYVEALQRVGSAKQAWTNQRKTWVITTGWWLRLQEQNNPCSSVQPASPASCFGPLFLRRLPTWQGKRSVKKKLTQRLSKPSPHSGQVHSTRKTNGSTRLLLWHL